MLKTHITPSVYGIGFIGVGKYKHSINRETTKEYSEWHAMLGRCYSDKCHERQPTYKDCYVNEEAHCFQNFAEWWNNNYYEIEGETMHLDKDILYKGNKEYSFNKMIFVPNRINTLFIKCDSRRGNLPIGVYYNKQNNKYVASCRIEKHQKFLGYYDTPHEAFLAYKTFKEQYIKQVADEYKGKIPDRLYDAMYSWEVEEDD